MASFSGFNSAKSKAVPVPAAFFSELLPEINDLVELKVTLLAFYLLNAQEGDLRYLANEDFRSDQAQFKTFGKTEEEAELNLQKGLEGCLRRGVLLSAKYGEETLYFLNSSRGKAALAALEKGSWQPDSGLQPGTRIEVERPNIFALYEQNIGPLTPIIAETLQEAEKLYPEEWIQDALKIAVTRNARNWRFIEAILRSWKEKGRDEIDQRSSKENRKRDSEGEFADYIIH